MAKSVSWYAKIRVKVGKTNRSMAVSVQARTASEAKALLQGQYGTNFVSFLNSPRKDRPYT